MGAGDISMTVTAYKLQKIMNKEAPLNVQHFKTYGKKKKKA